MSVSENAWRDLLAASVEMQTASGSSETHQPPSRENMEYLQNAMAATFGTAPEKSPIQQFLELGKKESLSDEGIDSALDIADQLTSLFCARHLPVVFTQNEGLDCLYKLTTKGVDEELRATYLQLLPLIAENNLEVQNVVVDHQLFQSLLNSLDENSSRTVNAAISAISAIVRSCPKAWHKFYELGGLQRFEKIIESSEKEKVAAKAAYVLTNIKFTLVECADEKLIKWSQVDKKYMDLCDVIFRSYVHLKKRKSSDEYVSDFLDTIQQKMSDLPAELCARISEDTKRKLADFITESDPKLNDKFHVSMNEKLQLKK